MDTRATDMGDGVLVRKVLQFEESAVDDGETLLGYQKPRKLKGSRNNRRGRFPKRQGHTHMKM